MVGSRPRRCVYDVGRCRHWRQSHRGRPVRGRADERSSSNNCSLLQVSLYKIYNESSGSVGAREKVDVNCTDSSEKFRFVIVQGSRKGAAAICLTGVAVYTRSDSIWLRILLQLGLKLLHAGNLALKKRAVQSVQRASDVVGRSRC